MSGSFRQFYNHTIYPELFRMERRRKKLIGLLVVMSVLIVMMIIGGMTLHIHALNFLMILPAFGYATWLSWALRKYIKTFKPRVTNLILDYIDNQQSYDTLHYFPEKGISKDVFLKSGLFITKSDFYQAEDHITGRIGDVDFELSEVNSKELAGEQSGLRKVFRGVFLRATFNRQVAGKLLILPAKSKAKKNAVIKKFTRAGGEEIKLNSEAELARECQKRYVTSAIDTLCEIHSDRVFFEEGCEAPIQAILTAYSKKYNQAYIDEVFDNNWPKMQDLFEQSLDKDRIESLNDQFISQSEIEITTDTLVDYLTEFGKADSPSSELRQSGDRQAIRRINEAFFTHILKSFIKTLNAAFAKEFIIFRTLGASGIMASSATLRNSLLNYYEKTNHPLNMVISGDGAYAALPIRKDLLEPKLFRSNLNAEMIDEFYEDLNTLLDLIEKLDEMF